MKDTIITGCLPPKQLEEDMLMKDFQARYCAMPRGRVLVKISLRLNDITWKDYREASQVRYEDCGCMCDNLRQATSFADMLFSNYLDHNDQICKKHELTRKPFK